MKQVRAARAAALLAVFLGALTSGCSKHGEFRITWSFTDGEIQGPYDCSQRGVEQVVVTLTHRESGEQHRSVHVCGLADSGQQTVKEGTYDVLVQALGPAGRPFTDPFTDEVTLVQTGEIRVTDNDDVAELAVTFTPNPKCADGVDNDGDGLVDAADPGCLDRNGDYDPDPSRDETDTASPGLLAVTWYINGALDTCNEVQPDGAHTASLMMDGVEVGQFDCEDGVGSIPLSMGSHAFHLRLLDAGDLVLAETDTQEATIIQDLTTDLMFDFSLDTFGTTQTGTLGFTFSWVVQDEGCNDASPIVATQSITLLDAEGQTVDASTLAGTSVDGGLESLGPCHDPTVQQGLTTMIPAGRYTLSVVGGEAGGEVCWSATFSNLAVSIGSNPSYSLIIPQTRTTGACAP